MFRFTIPAVVACAIGALAIAPGALAAPPAAEELNPPPPPAMGTGLPLDQITLPQWLKANGYATGMFGKWHLGMERPYRPWKRGFDEYVGFLHGQHDYFDWQDRKLNGRDSVIRYNPELDGAAVVEEEPFYFTDLLAREAMSFIDRRKDEPFFL